MIGKRNRQMLVSVIAPGLNVLVGQAVAQVRDGLIEEAVEKFRQELTERIEKQMDKNYTTIRSAVDEVFNNQTGVPEIELKIMVIQSNGVNHSRENI